MRNNVNINDDENGKLIRSQSVTNNKVKMKEIQPLNFEYQQNKAGSIPNGTISQSSLKTTKQVGTSTPKEIKRRLTFNILDNHRKSSVLDEISEENTKDSCNKVRSFLIKFGHKKMQFQYHFIKHFNNSSFRSHLAGYQVCSKAGRRNGS